MFQGVRDSEQPQGPATTPPGGLKPIAKTAAAMIQRDSKFLLFAYPLIVIAPLCASVLELTNPGWLILVSLLERCGQLLFIFLVSRRWIDLISSKTSRYSNASRFFAIGMAIWFMFAIPLTLRVLAVPDAVKFLTAPLLIGAVWFSLTYFFYPAPALLESSIGRALSVARVISQSDPWLTLKILSVPTGAVTLFMALSYAPWPDGRSQTMLIVGEVGSGIFTFLACYLGLATFFHRVPQANRQQLGLEPYLADRIATIQAQDFIGLGRLLTPRRGVQFLLFGIALWGVNFARLMEIPPAATVKVESIAVQDKLVTIELFASDNVFQFRGFHPLYLTLAGEQRAIIAEQPIAMELLQDGKIIPLGFTLPTDLQTAKIRLKFEASRSGAALAALEDLYLWYRGIKIEKLDMKNAKVVSNTTIEGATATPAQRLDQ